MYDTKVHGRRYDGSQRGRALAVLEETANVTAAAKASGATKRTVRRWAREAGLAPVRKGGRVTNLDRRSFLQLLAGQAAMFAAAPAAAAKVLARSPRRAPTGVVRAYFVPGFIYQHLASGTLPFWHGHAEDDVAVGKSLARALLESGPTAEPAQILEAVRSGFESGEIAVEWKPFRSAYASPAGLVFVNDTPDEVQIGACLWSTGHAQFFADGHPVELDLLTTEKAHALGLQLRRAPR